MAVDLLVMHPDAVDTSNGHPGGWTAGMVVDAFEAPDPRFPLGPGVDQHPRFIVVRIEDPITKADVEDLLQVLEDSAAEPDPETGSRPMKKKRVGYLDYSALNPPTMAAIRATRDVTITEGMYNSFVKRAT